MHIKDDFGLCQIWPLPIWLQNAFSHMFWILDDPEKTPLANLTALDDPAALHSSMHSSIIFPVTRTDSYNPATTLCQLQTNQCKALLITPWYFLLSTSTQVSNVGRCAATTDTATLSTYQDRYWYCKDCTDQYNLVYNSTIDASPLLAPIQLWGESPLPPTYS